MAQPVMAQPVMAQPAMAMAQPVVGDAQLLSGTPTAVMGISPNVALGPQDQVKLLDATTAGILASVDDFTIKQRVKWWEAFSFGCFEQRNTYDVFDEKTGTHLFIAQEVSEDCARCCCAPLHTLRVEFYLVNNPERQWLKANAESNFPLVMTLDRDGCCGSKPFICCFACGDGCKDKMVVHAGPQPREILGKNEVNDSTIAIIDQPACGGYCHPAFTLNSRMQPSGTEAESFKPIVEMKGPCFFGGCSELCCESEFLFSSIDCGSQASQRKSIGDLAVLKKKKPRDCSGCARELFTDSDHYQLSYKPDKGLTPQQKAGMMASIILMDFHLFEQDAGMCKVENNKITITICDTYCFGCVLPCNIVLQGNNN